VLAEPIAIVDKVTRRECPFRVQIDVAAVAIARVPLVLVPMTAEARRHLWAERSGARGADLHVAAYAVAAHFAHVPRVLEAQVLARELRATADVRLAMAESAVARVVRFGMAAEAVGGRWEVQGARVARGGNTGVTLDAIDPLQHVRAVLEWMRRGGAAETEHARARRERERKGKDERL
jgi:hypothetical protein